MKKKPHFSKLLNLIALALGTAILIPSKNIHKHCYSPSWSIPIAFIPIILLISCTFDTPIFLSCCLLSLQVASHSCKCLYFFPLFFLMLLSPGVLSCCLETNTVLDVVTNHCSLCSDVALFYVFPAKSVSIGVGLRSCRHVF